MTHNAENDAIHWGHVDSRPTSLHGNGAAPFERTTLDPYEVTCRLCVTLLCNSESLSWIDRQGDVWRVGDDGLMHTPETAPFPRSHVERKWGPLRLVETRVFPPGPDLIGTCPDGSRCQAPRECVAVRSCTRPIPPEGGQS